MIDGNVAPLTLWPLEIASLDLVVPGVTRTHLGVSVPCRPLSAKDLPDDATWSLELRLAEGQVLRLVGFGTAPTRKQVSAARRRFDQAAVWDFVGVPHEWDNLVRHAWLQLEEYVREMSGVWAQVGMSPSVIDGLVYGGDFTRELRKIFEDPEVRAAARETLLDAESHPTDYSRARAAWLARVLTVRGAKRHPWYPGYAASADDLVPCALPPMLLRSATAARRALLKRQDGQDLRIKGPRAERWIAAAMIHTIGPGNDLPEAAGERVGGLEDELERDLERELEEYFAGPSVLHPEDSFATDVALRLTAAAKGSPVYGLDLAAKGFALANFRPTVMVKVAQFLRATALVTDSPQYVDRAERAARQILAELGYGRLLRVSPAPDWVARKQ